MDSNASPEIIARDPAWPVPPPPSTPATNIFIGRFGLRAGWGIAIFVLLLVCLSFILNAGRHLIQHKPIFSKHSQSETAKAAPAKSTPEDTQAGEAIPEEGSVFLGIVLITWILSRIERRPIHVYGIGRNHLRDFLPGAFWGLATLSLLVGLLHVTHVLVFDARVLSGSAIFLFGAKWLVGFLSVGLLEEYATRGYFQYTLTRGLFGLGEKISPTHARAIAFWIATVIMSLVFGAGHLNNPGESAVGIIAVFLAGATFSYALFRTGSLWWAIGFHMAWDWAQSFLYGVPDSGIVVAGRLFHTHPAGKPLLSGGTTGPEGSIYIIPTLLLVVLLIRFTTRPGVQPTFEPQSSPDAGIADQPLTLSSNIS